MRSVGSTARKYPGRLIVVEGCDGSGKSTQLHLLKRWLEEQEYPVYFTEWNSSDLIKRSTKKAKKERALTPTTFSLVHACDFADRYETLILPHLQAGYLVLADRYIFTAFARDRVRGCDLDWVRSAYRFAARPDLTFYFQAPLEVSLRRILSGRPELKYHEAGMDLGLSTDPAESFQLFQGLIKEQYDRMARSYGFYVMDATRPIPVQQQEMRKVVARVLREYRVPAPGGSGCLLPTDRGGRTGMSTTTWRYYGNGLPYLKERRWPGRLIVLEGADGCGRSEQIARLKVWLERRGHAVAETGLKRSNLISDAISEAKQGNTLGRTTLSLLYATDLADQLENEIIPALRAGLVVLSDRYIYTPMARDMVRGRKPEWLEKLYGFALVPNLVVYLRTTPEERLHRTLARYRRLNYWESGMDLGLAGDRFTSFKRYQELLQAQYDRLAGEYGFVTVDGSLPISAVQEQVRDLADRVLEGGLARESV